jgi:SPP1 gp7 family putative phage head morphogenesis protein
MPRARKRDLSRIDLTAYPEMRDVTVVPGPDVMTKDLFKRPPLNDLYRQRYGRSLTLNRIQQALDAAQQGYMRDLTDMSRETMGLDPHLTSVLYKRLNAVASLPWEVRPAEGPGVDERLAQAYADFCREQLLMVSGFRQAIVQLAWGLFDGRSALETHWVDRADTFVSKSKAGDISLPIRWRVGSLGWIHPRRLCFDADRDLYINDTNISTSFYNTNPKTMIGVGLKSIPYKFIQFTPQLFGDYPELEGLAPKCLYWSFMKRFGARERMILVELFGKPWRIITVDEDSDAGPQELEDATAIADSLGDTASARMPRGTKLEVVSTDPKSGDLHQQVIDTSDKQISKLVLGQTGTTDAQPGALGGGMQSLVMNNEQQIILGGDAAMLSEAIEDYLTDAIIATNFGQAALINAPRFVLRSETTPDKKNEGERLKLALDMGLPIEIDEAYDVLGFKKPEPKSIVIQVTSSPGPMGTVEKSAKITVAPEMLEAQQKAIDDALKAASPDTTTPAIAPTDAVTTPEAVPANDQAAQPAAPAAKPPAGNAASVIKDVLGLEAPASDEEVQLISREFERILLAQIYQGGGEHEHHEHGDAEHVALANRQPDTVHGTIETLIDKGVKEAARVSNRWCEALVASVRGADKASEINKRLVAAADRLDLLQYARTIERRMTHSAMAGALDSQWEAETDNQVAPEKFPAPDSAAASRSVLAPVASVEPEFTSMAYKEALKFFNAKQPVPKATFAKLSSAAKARSFTVAGLASEYTLSVAKSELANAIVAGTPLKEFAANLAKRFESAGLTPLSPSHAETVFRTNLLTSYNVGRKTEMTQPDVLKLRPYWQIRGVADDRQRDAHAAVNGWILRASDPFWRSKGGPPWGFNCRCRTASISPTKLSGRQVRTGAEIRDLPDPGFDAVAF